MLKVFKTLIIYIYIINTKEILYYNNTYIYFTPLRGKIYFSFFATFFLFTEKEGEEANRKER